MGLLLSFFYLSWCTKYYELQRHLVGVRGYGHDKSVPYGCWRSAKMLLIGCYFALVYVYANTIKLCANVHLQLAMAQQHTQNAYFRNAKTILLHGKKGFFVFRYNGRRFCRCWKTVLLCRGCGLRHCNFYAIVLVYQIAKSGTNVVASHIFYNVTEVCIYVYSIV